MRGRKLYIAVCVVLFSAIMFGVHEFLQAVIYGTPLWAATIFTAIWIGAMLAIGLWMERRKHRH